MTGKQILQAATVVVFIAILVFINRAAWALGDLMSPPYLYGFVTGMAVTLLWFRFLMWAERRQ